MSKYVNGKQEYHISKKAKRKPKPCAPHKYILVDKEKNKWKCKNCDRIIIVKDKP